MFATEKAKKILSTVAWVLAYTLTTLCLVIPWELNFFFFGIIWVPIYVGLIITFSILFFKKKCWYFKVPLIFLLLLLPLAYATLLLDLAAGWWYLF